MKTPVRDGLNFKSLPVIKELIPRRTIVGSFLLFSGAIELGLVGDQRFVIAHTNKRLVYDFWKCITEDSRLVADHAVFFFNNLLNPPPPWKGAQAFLDLQQTWPNAVDPFAMAAKFFVLNRCSESGLVSSGEFSPEGLNPMSIGRLKTFKAPNFYLVHDDKENFSEALRDPEDSQYLFLPVGRYNHNIFDHGKNRAYETTLVHHQELCEKLIKHHKKWVVLYKNHAGVFDLYKGHHIIMVDQYGRKTNKKDKCEDIVIANF